MRDVVYCPICNNAFADSEIEHIQTAAGDRYSPPEYVARCPFCGAIGEGFEEGFECEYCNEMYPDYQYSEVDGMCQCCFDTSIKKIGRYIDAHGDKADTAVFSLLLNL